MSKSGDNQPVDRYLRRQILGEGTYGVVYKATDTKVKSKTLPDFVFNFIKIFKLNNLRFCDFLRLGKL